MGRVRRLYHEFGRTCSPRSSGWLVVLAALALVPSSAAVDPAAAPAKPTPLSWAASDLNVSWLGHATVLVGFHGTNLLIDPVLFDRIGLTLGGVTIGPKRLVGAALSPDELPRLDAVLISHAHMDHLDLPSLRAVAAAPLLVVPERTRDVVEGLGFTRVVELPWGAAVESGGVTIEALRVEHWGRRWPWEGWRGYDGFLITRDGVSVLFASDTAYADYLAPLARARNVDVMILGIGAYDPWIWNHLSPEQAWQTFADSGARWLVPVHYDVFRLGKEAVGEAMRRLVAATGADAGRIAIRRVGETLTIRGR
jgi:L-ascorbate metabolism protein UlaG (beta-lactamase superfamily)